MRSAFYWGVWHASSAVVLSVLLPPLFGVVPWLASRAEAESLLVLWAGYGVGVLLGHVVSDAGGWRGTIGRYLAMIGCWVPSLAILSWRGAELPAGLVFGVTALGAALLVVPHHLARRRVGALGGFGAIVALALVATGLTSDRLRLEPLPTVSVEQRATALYALSLTRYTDFVPHSYSGVAGGGVVEVDGGGLLITGDGDAYAFDLSSDSASVQSLGWRAPLNRDEFEEHVGPTGYRIWFRVLGVAATRADGVLRLFVSHHYWRADDRCFVVRISRLDLPEGVRPGETEPADWATVYETTPCLSLQTETHPGWPFRGMEGGGRMVLLGQQGFLFTVGDHGFNGVDFPLDLVNDPDASYGKSILVPLDGAPPSVFTTGHRNAQGLTVTRDGMIWSTEHGPEGGDELNMLESGVHYGWPTVTHGTDYGSTAWPLNPEQGRHEGFAPPAYSWVPSAGVSVAIEATSSLFPAWSGDLLVGSLVGRTLYRVRARSGDVVFAEPIEIGEPIRDLYVDSQGRLVIWTDRYNFVVLAPAAMAFAACSGCHQLGDGTAHGVGPDLGGLAGRQVASAADFPYSPALSGAGGAWDAARLDAFLADPQEFAPGTTMQMRGIDDADLRRAIADYLGVQE